jgi:hypothetical protein
VPVKKYLEDEKIGACTFEFMLIAEEISPQVSR